MLRSLLDWWCAVVWILAGQLPQRAGEEQKSIAQDIGISFGHVSAIVTGRDWKHTLGC